MFIQRIAFLVSLTIPFASGCGEKLDRTVPVDGVLTFNGKALPHYQVDFLPVENTKRPAASITDAEGKFVLGTNAPGDGAVIGKHKITVTFVGADGPVVGIDPASTPVAEAKPKFNIPAKYQDPAKTDLEVDVTASGLRGYALDLK